MQDIGALIQEIQQGNEKLREELLASQMDFVLKYSSFLCKRKLDWQNDDELSIALMAFNKAIDTFNPSLGNSFFSYSRLLIKNSLIDYFRKQRKDLFVQLAPDSGDGSSFAEDRVSQEAFLLEEENRERAYDVQRFKEILEQFGLSLQDLPGRSPRHFDTRDKLKEIVLKTCRDQELVERIYRQKRLPLKEIQILTGEKRKLLEKWRKYLLAMILISTHYELESLSIYIWGKGVLPRNEKS